jgi:hypothetical protein
MHGICIYFFCYNSFAKNAASSNHTDAGIGSQCGEGLEGQGAAHDEDQGVDRGRQLFYTRRHENHFDELFRF